jgi:methionyl-tRNA synthetase
VLGWLGEMVTSTLQRAPGETVADSSLVALGGSSLHAVALQYQISERSGVEVSVEELMGERSVADLAGLVARRMREERMHEVVA